MRFLLKEEMDLEQEAGKKAILEELSLSKDD